MKNFYYIIALSLSFLCINACNEDDSPSVETVNNSNTIGDFIAESADFSILQAAVERVGLEIALDGTTPYTLFAPNDGAFENYFLANGYEGLTDIPSDSLTNLMINHLTSGARGSSELSGFFNTLAKKDEYQLTANGSTVGATIINFSSTILDGDKALSNGIVHVVDAVVPIPSLKDFITAGDSFSSFNEALVAASDEEIDYIELLSREKSNFTIIAPSNEAFSSLLNLYGVTSFNDLPLNSLRRLLNYHIISGENLQTTDFIDGDLLNTNDSEDILLAVTNQVSFIDATGNPTEILNPNIQTANGVIHQIDNVLLSSFIFDEVDPTITGLVEMNGTLSLLEIALTLTGLDEVLNDRASNFTLLAPNNTAFNAYLQGEDIDDIPLEVLTQLLLNHTFTAVINETDFETGYTQSSAVYEDTENKLSMYVDTNGEVMFNGVSSILEPNLAAANGLMHIVDGVVELPTVVTFISADPNFELLETALTRDDQPDYPAILSVTNGVAPFTIFAPDNNAFNALLIELNLSDLSEIDTEVLTNSLNTHVISDISLRAEDLMSQTYTTLGDEISIDVDDLIITDANARESSITATNLQAVNGVVHTINKVLLSQ